MENASIILLPNPDRLNRAISKKNRKIKVTVISSDVFFLCSKRRFLDIPIALLRSEISFFCRYDGLEYGYRSTGSFTEEMYARSRNEGFNEIVRDRIIAGNYFLLREYVSLTSRLFGAVSTMLFYYAELVY